MLAIIDELRGMWVSSDADTHAHGHKSRTDNYAAKQGGYICNSRDELKRKITIKRASERDIENLLFVSICVLPFSSSNIVVVQFSSV